MPTRYLFTVSIGPVQEFICSARRTRDLWAGSHLLSEISRTTAASLREHGELIFPGFFPADRTRNVSNIQLAVVDLEVSPGDFAKVLKQGAVNWLREQGELALTQVRSHRCAEEERFREQIADILEFYSAWIEFDGNDYPAKRSQVARLLAARKNCREFGQARSREMQVPKSSLDGNRETVIRKDADLSFQRPPGIQLFRDLRLSSGEELDAIGLTKRMSAIKYFPSISRIAAEPWIRGRSGADLAVLSGECAKIGSLHLPSHDWPHLAHFPHEGSVLYEDRHPELQREFQVEDLAKRDALQAIKKLLRDNRTAWGQPQPYVAILQADGDRMGGLISSLGSVEEHQQFSSRLALFASQVQKIVQAHQGCLIYAGADDVLALLPLHTCLDVAQELKDSFETHLGETNLSLPEEKRATLSVGLGVGHFMDPMEDLLDLAGTAEKQAKQDGRNRLCLIFQPRSGTAISYSEAWPEMPGEKLRKYTQWHLDEAISDKAGYDLSRMLALYAGSWSEGESGMQALKDDARRVLGRKKRANPQLEQATEQVAATLNGLTSYPEAQRLCNGLMIARRLKKAYEQAGVAAVAPAGAG